MVAAQGHEVRVITAPPYYPQWRWARTIPPGGTNEKRGPPRWALPAVRAKTAEHPETPVTSRSFAVSSFFPLMAQRRWKPDALSAWCQRCFARRECACWRNLWCAYRAAYSGLRSRCHAGVGLAGKGKGGKVAQLATAFEVADCITSITSPRFRVR